MLLSGVVGIPWTWCITSDSDFVAYENSIDK